MAGPAFACPSCHVVLKARTAPAAGLYLWQVEYPAVYGIPLPQPGPIALDLAPL